MYEELFERLPDKGAYLARLGLAGQALPPDLNTLNTLLHAHVRHVPFENLDAWNAGVCPSLGVRAMFEKMILGHRGGWCHELNGLLLAFLTAMGYKAYAVGGRVWTDNGFPTPLGHRGVVCVLDGKKYYCDVGFGDVVFQSVIALDGTPSAYGFHIEKNGDWYEIWRDDPGKRRLLLFADIAFEPVDFLYPNTVSATDPDEKFRRELFVSIMRGERRLLLRNNTLTEQSDGQRRVLAEAGSADELTGILREYFGIEYAI